MELGERINEDFKKALQERDALKISVSRMLKAAITNREIEKRKKEEGLTNDELLEVVLSEAKKRKDAIGGFRKGGREDLAQKEEKELMMLSAYLPEEISEEEIRKFVQAAIQKVGAAGLKDFGKVMGVLMPEVKGRADGQVISRIVKEML